MAHTALLGQLPTTNIYSFKIKKVGNSLRFDNPKFITAFNKDGYNNQPAFFGDKEVYFTTDYYDKTQTEISKFDFFEKTLTRITYTPEKEYSPLPVPGKDAFSVVRVESDTSLQTLSIYPLDGIGIAKRYLNNTSNVGYHIWLDDENLGLFLVEEPNHNLAIAHAISERRKIVLDKIGRCLKVDENSNLIFVHKQDEEEWWIKSYNPQSSKSTTIVKAILGAEDFEILNDGTIIMGSKSKLYRFKPNSSDKWEEIANFANQGINNIKRIAIRKNRILLVNEG